MKTCKLAPAAFGLLLAATQPMFAVGVADTDGDGMVTAEEFATAYPELGVEDFAAADTNADGMLDTDELSAATEAGILPVLEG